jgi:hypothetical protein
MPIILATCEAEREDLESRSMQEKVNETLPQRTNWAG